MKLTKEMRQEIVREFALRNGGRFNPNLFLEEVRNKGIEHPAFDYFEWDDKEAAAIYRLEQAREFVRDLKVSFSVQEVGQSGPIKVRTVEMPFTISPVETRRDGGGYLITDPTNPEHMAEYCRQAAVALNSWMVRYEAAVAHIGVRPKDVWLLIDQLNNTPAAKLLAAE